ncbi:ATP-binding protein [Streptomyces globisporus]|uniref:ATP-binding protein n=1 Tax=Streptomyces globisporus TaxID=1908 RepID=UPI00068D785F|nr:ATP-binding protein [Streptomyces globisporus]
MNSRSETRPRTAVGASPAAAGARGGPSPLLTPAQARRLVSRTLADLGPLRDSQVDDLLLVTSELVTNAHRHGGGLTSFGIAVGGDRVTVSVADASVEPPRHEPREGLRPGGFGWPIVLRLCREVSVDARPDGKTVHAAVTVDR